MSLTLSELLALADRTLGGRKQVLSTLNVSRQRLSSACTGGPPLRIVRLLRLAIETGVAPVEALRAGGQYEAATLLERANLTNVPELTPLQRVVLQRAGALSTEAQEALCEFLGRMVADEPELPADDTQAG